MTPLFRVLTPLESLRLGLRYMVPRRWLCVALVLASLAAGGFLNGCATAHAPRMTHAPLPPMLVSTSDITMLQAICAGLDHGRSIRLRPGEKSWVYFGCVERDYANGVCVIYTEPNPPSWIIADELDHCAGGSHP